MAKGVYAVQTSPADPAQDQLFNSWYSGTHIPEVLAIPGFVSARLLRLATEDGGQPEFLALYEIEAEDVASPVAELTRRLTGGEMTLVRELRFAAAPVTKLYRDDL